jgi:hypothetical protein
MKKIKDIWKMISLVFLLSLFFASCCTAQEIIVKASKDVYYPNDNIIIINKIKNSDSEKILTLETRISGEGFRYYPTLMKTGAYFNAEEEKEINFTLYVIDTMPAGRYKVVSSLFDGEKLINESTCYFEVKNTLKIIDIDLFTCKDRYCTNLATLFYKGETVYMSYKSSVEDLTIDTILTPPDKTEKKITLPSSYVLQLPGTYLIKVTASKDGYKSVTKEIEFGALEEEIKVFEGEKWEPAKKQFSEFQISYTFIIIGIFVIIGIAMIIFWIRKKKK